MFPVRWNLWVYSESRSGRKNQKCAEFIYFNDTRLAYSIHTLDDSLFSMNSGFSRSYKSLILMWNQATIIVGIITESDCIVTFPVTPPRQPTRFKQC